MTDAEVIKDYDNMPKTARESVVAPYFQSVQALWENCYTRELIPLVELQLNILDAKREVLKCARGYN